MIKPTDGFFVIDKPGGLTSHGVVLAVRRHLKIRKVGHLGTLDPMATGVLPLAIGKATRLAQFLSGGLKIYHGTFRLGFSTDTFDREGKATSPPVLPSFSPEQLEAVRCKMVGEQFQVPPPYSAKQIKGVRAYLLARQGEDVSLPARRIHIQRLDLIQRQADEVEFEIHCSAGTYVRSVAHELGKKLACGAHLAHLRRVASGEFHLAKALPLDSFVSSSWTDLAKHFISMSAVLLDLPQLEVGSEIQDRLAHGRDFTFEVFPTEVSANTLFRLVSPQGELLGLAEVSGIYSSTEVFTKSHVRFHPKVILF